jgi:hypothetical protein
LWRNAAGDRPAGLDVRRRASETPMAKTVLATSRRTAISILVCVMGCWRLTELVARLVIADGYAVVDLRGYA